MLIFLTLCASRQRNFSLSLTRAKASRRAAPRSWSATTSWPSAELVIMFRPASEANRHRAGAL